LAAIYAAANETRIYIAHTLQRKVVITGARQSWLDFRQKLLCQFGMSIEISQIDIC